jgi:hypothetical protein
MNDAYAWKNFGRHLDSAKQSIKKFQYRGIFDAPDPSGTPDFRDIFKYQGLPPGALAFNQLDKILSVGALGPPHGLALLQPPPAPGLPSLPEMPSRALMKDYESHWIAQHQSLSAELEKLRETTAAKIADEQKQGAELASAEGRMATPLHEGKNRD